MNTRRGRRRWSPLHLGLALIWMHLRGYREAPGYTVLIREGRDDAYCAMELTRNPHRMTKNVLKELV